MPKALISIDNHFVALPDGTIKCENIVDQSFWDRYLEVFETIDVFVRTETVTYDSKYDDYNSVEHPNVNIIPVPMFKTIKELVFNFFEIRSIIKNQDLNRYEAIIVRLPSLLGFLVCNHTVSHSIPCGVEVVADMSTPPSDSGLGGKVKALIFHSLLKHYVRKANGVAYVTKNALQLKYPANSKAIQNHYSSINLDSSYFYDKTNEPKDEKEPFLLIHVSTLNSNAKGHKVFIDTIERLSKDGYNVQGLIVGGGSLKSYYEDYSKEKNIEDAIKFTGAISNPKELRDLYIQSDILLFPSEFEGLPRTVIEAMSCSLAVVASNVGGIPELLDKEWLSSFDDTDFFYRKTKELIDHPQLLEQTSRENYKKAFEYEASQIQKRRNQFFSELLEAK